mmetsp:Transcript_15692/g.42777  ORF Transcript_15692/g.42777 Transcript_15692/m.42777 type:complete len:220 (+) Transcript_15692:744-1403(+)
MIHPQRAAITDLTVIGEGWLQPAAGSTPAILCTERQLLGRSTRIHGCDHLPWQRRSCRQPGWHPPRPVPVAASEGKAQQCGRRIHGKPEHLEDLPVRKNHQGAAVCGHSLYEKVDHIELIHAQKKVRTTHLKNVQAAPAQGTTDLHQRSSPGCPSATFGVIPINILVHRSAGTCMLSILCGVDVGHGHPSSSAKLEEAENAGQTSATWSTKRNKQKSRT